MRNGSTLRVLAVCLCCAAALAGIGCAATPSPVKANDPAFGTWINPAYDGEKDRPGKWALFKDGRELDYVYIADTEPYGEGRNNGSDGSTRKGTAGTRSVPRAASIRLPRRWWKSGPCSA